MQCNFPSHLLNANLMAENLCTCKKTFCCSEIRWNLADRRARWVMTQTQHLQYWPLLEVQTSKFSLLISNQPRNHPRFSYCKTLNSGEFGLNSSVFSVNLLCLWSHAMKMSGGVYKGGMLASGNDQLPYRQWGKFQWSQTWLESTLELY